MAAQITSDLVRQLRETTGAGMMECKKALNEASGDLVKAQEVLRKKGMEVAKKKASRQANEGRIFSYIHMGGKIAVLVELQCETDFVAKTDDFNQLGQDVAMQIAAVSPQYVKAEEVPQAFIEKEKEIIREASKDQLKGKPEQVIEKILGGKLEKNLQDICLLNQPFVKDPKQTIKDYVTAVVAKLGENIQVKRFVRYEVGHE